MKVRVFLLIAISSCVFGSISFQLSQTLSIESSRKDFTYDFGSVVAVSADASTIAVGNPSDNEGGRVYIYNISDESWNVTTILEYPYPNFATSPRFGSSLAFAADGNLIVVGAPTDTIAGFAGAGSVYVFVKNNSTYELLAQLYNTDQLTVNQRFGSTVAVSSDGNIISVTAAYNVAAYCTFFRSGLKYHPQCSFETQALNYNYYLGMATGLSGDGTILTYYDGNSMSGNRLQLLKLNSTGNGYVLSQTFNSNGAQQISFSEDGSTFVVVSGGTLSWYSLSSTFDKVGTKSGLSSALNGTGVILAAGENGGIVQILSLSPSSGTMNIEQSLNYQSFSGASEYFGSSVALSSSGDLLVVGSPTTNQYPGQAMVFTQT